MSRIILKKYPGTDENHIVVGWDRPVASYYWQEFNKEPVVEQGGEGKWYVTSPAFATPQAFNSELEANEHKWDDWEEMVRVAGYEPNELPTVDAFMQSVPTDLQPLMTEQVIELLREHSMDPDTGRIIVDLAKEPKSFKVEVKTYAESEWVSNAVRFATEAEAKEAAKDLAGRWTMVEEHRVAPSDDPVNYKWEDGKAVSV